MKALCLLLGFAACLFLLYSLMQPVVIEYTSAASVNLNLLSADFYTLLVGLYVFKYQFHFLYFLSFGLIIAGVVLYSLRAPPVGAADSDHQVAAAGQTTSLLVAVTGGDQCNYQLLADHDTELGETGDPMVHPQTSGETDRQENSFTGKCAL